MFHGEKNNGNVKNKKDVFTDEKINNSPSSTTQTIIFPCIGPPGSGPGLLGSRPGVMKTDYLTALEHHANSLKSALTIAATLRNEGNKDLNVEGVYDSICDIETELKSRNDYEENHH